MTDTTKSTNTKEQREASKAVGTTEPGVDTSIRDSAATGGGWFGKPPQKEPVGAVTPSHDDADDPSKQTENKDRAAQQPKA
jgi:hypothetical protein